MPTASFFAAQIMQNGSVSFDRILPISPHAVERNIAAFLLFLTKTLPISPLVLPKTLLLLKQGQSPPRSYNIEVNEKAASSFVELAALLYPRGLG